MGNNLKLSKSQRNMGIEYLRILSMLMVVILHCLGHGGVLKNLKILSTNYNIAWLLETACYGAVNLYALITGYVCVQSRHRWSRILELWLQVAFYSISLTVLFYFLPGYDTGKKDLIRVFFPVMSKQYWYFSSYFCLFVFMPFINKAIHSLSRLDHTKLIFTGAFVFCFLGMLAGHLGEDIFLINNGYSPLWLAFLYVVGAYLKLYPETIKAFSKKSCLAGYFICVVCAWSSKLLIEKFIGKGSNLFISYISPLILLACIFLFMFFTQLNVNHGAKFIAKISGLTFGVYIISENHNIRDNFINNRFIGFVDKSWYVMIGCVLLGALAIYIVCSIIEGLRSSIFSLLCVRKLCERIVEFTKSKFSSFMKNIAQQ